MKKTIVAVLLFLAFVSAHAQVQNPKRFAVGVGGGPLMSLSENFFTYPENGKFGGLISGEGNIWATYQMSKMFAVRLSVGAGGNSGAKNSREKSGHGFYPYRFASVNTFADIMVDPRGRHSKLRVFTPAVYLGVGYACTLGFDDNNVPYHFQIAKGPNHCFGFRAGFVASFALSQLVELYVDAALEAYTDNYNGLRPTNADQSTREGYAGFPFDLRIPLNFGVRFNL